MTDETQQSKTIGRYLVLDEIGRGGMGVVYRGFDPAIGRPVALKMLILPADDEESRELKQRLYREAGAAGGLAHPNIVTIYDVVEEGPAIAVAMELVQGVTLQSIIAERGPLPVEDALTILEQVCAALDFASQRGIVHRDIKPANIHVTPAGTIKVMDFGVARLERSEMTRAGTVLGSPRYMSPEQVRGLPLDGRSDLFSAAVVFYEMITRERPFAGSDIATTMYRIVHEPPTPAWQVNPGIGQRIDAVLEKALSKDREGRYAVGTELVAALRQAYAHRAGEEPTVAVMPAAPTAAPATRVTADRSVTVAVPAAAAGGGAPAVSEAGRTIPTAIRADGTRPTAPMAVIVPAPAAAPVTAPPGDAPAAAVEPGSGGVAAVPTEEKAAFASAAPTTAPSEPAIEPVDSRVAAARAEDAAALVSAPAAGAPAAAPLPGDTHRTAVTATVPGQAGPAAAPAPRVKPAAGAGRRFPVAAAVILVVVFAAAGGGAWWLFGRGPAAPPQPAGGKPGEGPGTGTEPPPLASQAPPAVTDQNASLPSAVPSGVRPDERPQPAVAAAARGTSAEARGKKPATGVAAPSPTTEKARAASAPAPEPSARAAAEPPRQVPMPAKTYEITEVDVKPAVTRQIPADYPEQARRQGLQDVIVVRVLVTESGEVADARITRRAQKEPAFEPAALAAVRQWSFKPAEKRGKPVACWLSVGVAFSPPRVP